MATAVELNERPNLPQQRLVLAAFRFHRDRLIAVSAPEEKINAITRDIDRLETLWTPTPRLKG